MAITLLHLVALRASVRDMSRSPQEPATEAQARYAHLRALIDIRLAELAATLDRHEARRTTWELAELLLAVEEGVGKLVVLLDEPEQEVARLKPDWYP